VAANLDAAVGQARAALIDTAADARAALARHAEVLDGQRQAAEGASHEAGTALAAAVAQAREAVVADLEQALAGVRESVERARVNIDLDMEAQRVRFEMATQDAHELLKAVHRDAEVASPAQVAAALGQVEQRLTETSGAIAAAAQRLGDRSEAALEDVTRLVAKARMEVNDLLDDAALRLEKVVEQHTT